MARVKRLLAAAAALVAAASVLTGCTQAVPLEAAGDAKNVVCASVSVALPDVVAEQRSRETTAQATGAWGDPAVITLQCGVTVPGPSTLPCVQVGDVYWLRDDSAAPIYRFTTYGRDPAVQVVADDDVVAPGVALYDLQSAVDLTKPTGAVCSDIEDSLGAATETPTSPSTPGPVPSS